MESLKTLVNALRALFDGVDSKFADVRNGLARVWEWINGLAWVARSETIERLPETTVHFEGTWNADNQISAPLGAIVNTAGLVAGQKYTVYFDGNAHPMYYYVGEGSSGFFYDLDNLLFGGDFTLVGNSTEWTAYLTGGASGTSCNESHTFSIPAEVKPEEKLPSIFLDMDWIPKAGTVDLLTDYVIADHPDDWDSQGTNAAESFRYKLPAPLFRLNAGETLTITWGGEEYSCVATIVDIENYHIPAAGNLSLGGLGDEDNGMPFLFADLYTAMNPSPDVLVFPFTIAVAEDRAESFARSPLTVRANRLELPEEMLPQSVKEDIDGKLNARNPSGLGYFEMNPWYDMDGNVEYTPGQFSFNAGWHGRASGDYAANIGSGAANGKRSVNIGSGAANGDGSIAIGHYTQAASAEQTAMGRYNIVDKVEKYLFILGKGSGDTSRSNAFTVTPTGNGWFAGDVYVGSTSGSDMDEGSVKLLKEGGDGSNLTASYTVPDVRESLTSGEKLSTALGKIAKWLGALDEDVARYKNGQLATIAGVVIPTGGGGGGGGDVVVDIALNADSTNPVQNAAIYAALDGKAPKDHDHSAADIKTGTLPISRGGTGASTAEDARANLDVCSKAEVAAAITRAIGDAIAASY